MCTFVCVSYMKDAAIGNSTYNAIRRFSTLCKELTMKGNAFFETNKNLPHH